LVPNSINENDTLNFFCVPPQSSDVDFFVTVNPLRTVVESDYANNSGAALNKSFLCRKMVELAYVSINYTPSGGEPPQNMVAPGTGDAFLRGIYKTGDWNYHRSPLGALTWTSAINNSSSSLLNKLNDIRNTQIPAAGYPKPEFVFGWLPGNPYSGNGQASGIPSAVAFGNTEASRFQRTFAHEIGHCWGEQHNSLTIGTVGFDVLSQLLDPLALPPVMITTKKDVMYAGQLTNAAWVAPGTFNDCINDDRSACTSDNDSLEGGGGASDSPRGERCLRIAGEYQHDRGVIVLEQSQRIDLAEPTTSDPAGDVIVSAFDAGGQLLTSIRMRTGTARECCSGNGLLSRTPFYALLPETVAGKSIASVSVKDIVSRKVIATQARSANAPTAAVTAIGSAMPKQVAGVGGVDAAAALDGDVEVRWAASDADGDALTAMLLYSPDGGDAWVPLSVNLSNEISGAENSFVFNTSNVPQSIGPNGIVKVRVSDGMNIVDGEFPVGMMFGLGTPPDVNIISPNANITVPQFASVVLQASAWDMDDQLLPESSVSWTSDIDGALGTGRLFVVNRLSPGTHTLTLTGTDSSGLSQIQEVTLTVSARDVRSSDLDFDGNVDAADLAILLGAWGSAGSIADLNLDGTVNAADLASLLGDWN
ncbi:MAG: hypothetical protein SGJ09_06780, partial [Phycisphaerae bacterium]|nr:hypothetical protein [Phycisphaerae bacterium]